MGKCLLVLLFASNVLGVSLLDRERQRHLDAIGNLHPADLVEYFGYPVERHWVTTEDGYVLSTQRLPRGSQEGGDGGVSTRPKPVVILVHGFLGTTADWLIFGPEKSLAFKLVDAGFDVWLMNLRGNTYSRNHTTLSPNDSRFWDFTYHEHGVYDVPAVVEHVVRRTGQDQVHLVGYSMSANAVLIAATERPDAARHVKFYTAIAPVTATAHTSLEPLVGLGILSFVSNVPERLTGSTLIAAREAFAEPWRTLSKSLRGSRAGRRVLVASWRSLHKNNVKQDDPSLVPTFLSRFPAGTSFKTFNHFIQGGLAGFRQYDYGWKRNLELYGSSTAPAYNLSKIQTPVQILYGENDAIADKRDVLQVCSELPNVRRCEAVPDPDWTHINFVYARGVGAVSDDVVASLEAFERGD